MPSAGATAAARPLRSRWRSSTRSSRARRRRQPDRRAAARAGALRVPARAGGRRDRAVRAACRHRASTASSLSTRSSARCPAASTRCSSVTAPRATSPARRGSPRRSSRSWASPTARPPPTWTSRSTRSPVWAPARRRRSCASTTRPSATSPPTRRATSSAASWTRLGGHRGDAARRRRGPARCRTARVASESARRDRRATDGVVAASRRSRRQRRVQVCAGTACVFAGSMKVRDAFVERGRGASARRLGRGLDHRLPRPLLAGAAGGGLGRRRHVLPAAQARSDVARIVERASQRRHGRRGAALRDPEAASAIACAHDIPFYSEADAHRAARRGRHRPRDASTSTSRAAATRPRARSLTGMTPDCGHRRGPGLGPARARRRRLPHGHEVGASRATSPGDVKYIICNGDEGDPGAFMDRVDPRGRPARRDRGHGHRRVRDRRARGLHLRARRVPARRQAPAHRASPQAAGARPPRRRHPRHAAWASTSRSRRAPAPSSAARRRR